MRGWARKMERGCRRPCKNKELVFFLVRKSVNTSGVFATPIPRRCVELMDVRREYENILRLEKKSLDSVCIQLKVHVICSAYFCADY